MPASTNVSHHSCRELKSLRFRSSRSHLEHGPAGDVRLCRHHCVAQRDRGGASGGRIGKSDDQTSPPPLRGEYSLRRHRGRRDTPIQTKACLGDHLDRAFCSCAGVHGRILQCSDEIGWPLAGLHQSCPCCADQPGQELRLPRGPVSECV